MIEAFAIAGGVGLALVLFGSRKRRRRVPPVVVDPARPHVPAESSPATDVEPSVTNPPAYLRNRAEPRSQTRLERIAKLLADNVKAEPTFGFLYAVRRGDTLPGIVKAAFDRIGGASAQQRLHYIHCLSSGSYNAGRYGTPSTSKRFGAEMLAPGSGLGLRVAFLPRNEDALSAMLRGRMPTMTVDARTGEPLGEDGSYALLWMLPVNEAAVRAGDLPSCAAFNWRDGSSTIDPDPELLRLLREDGAR